MHRSFTIPFGYEAEECCETSILIPRIDRRSDIRIFELPLYECPVCHSWLYSNFTEQIAEYLGYFDRGISFEEASKIVLRERN